MEAGEPETFAPLPEPWTGPGADSRSVDRAAALLRDAERPVVMAGTGLYWGKGEESLLALAQELRIPVFLNGLGRGSCPPITSCSSPARAGPRSARRTWRW